MKKLHFTSIVMIILLFLYSYFLLSNRSHNPLLDSVVGTVSLLAISVIVVYFIRCYRDNEDENDENEYENYDLGFYKENPNAPEFTWHITPAAKCKGGDYMFQGDSQAAVMCQQMMKDPLQRELIGEYNCGTGFIGMPAQKFQYQPLSDDNFQNSRCGN